MAKTAAMDKILKTIEQRADAIDFHIDTHEEWIWLNRLVTRLQFDEPVTISEKMQCIDTLQAFCLVLGLNYSALLHKYTEEAWA